jgi:hypothetical protein
MELIGGGESLADMLGIFDLIHQSKLATPAEV